MTARKLHVKPGNVIVILYSLINKYQLASIGFHQELRDPSKYQSSITWNQNSDVIINV